MCKRIVGLDPIVFKDSRVLILGSMPSVISLKEQMYYANKNNRFWKILESLYQENDKIELLKISHIALWDICHSCIRKTSADSEIKDIEPNNIPFEYSENISALYSDLSFDFKCQCTVFIRTID